MKGTKIDWCDATWNPVTGCLHGCTYCYAERITRRFGKKLPDYAAGKTEYCGRNLHVLETRIAENPFPFGFEPTLHAYRLSEPARWKKPQTVFVGSMADLFGDWVPDEWIADVFAAMGEAPQHRYLFLTKNPERYSDLPPKWFKGLDVWLGTTVTGPQDRERAHLLAESWRCGANWFVSVEPLHGRLDAAVLDDIEVLADWVIIGAETGQRGGKVQPNRAWIEEIVEACDRREIPVFMKKSLQGIMGDGLRQEFPWKTE